MMCWWVLVMRPKMLHKQKDSYPRHAFFLLQLRRCHTEDQDVGEAADETGMVNGQVPEQPEQPLQQASQHPQDSQTEAAVVSIDFSRGGQSQSENMSVIMIHGMRSVTQISNTHTHTHTRCFTSIQHAGHFMQCNASTDKRMIAHMQKCAHARTHTHTHTHRHAHTRLDAAPSKVAEAVPTPPAAFLNQWQGYWPQAGMYPGYGQQANDGVLTESEPTTDQFFKSKAKVSSGLADISYTIAPFLGDVVQVGAPGKHLLRVQEILSTFQDRPSHQNLFLQQHQRRLCHRRQRCLQCHQCLQRQRYRCHLHRHQHLQHLQHLQHHLTQHVWNHRLNQMCNRA